MPQPFAVDAWQWRQMLLSEYGPAKPNTRLVALSVARNVGGTQTEAWPAQKTIACNARVSLRTGQRLLAELEESGWCRRGRGPMGGKGWALTAYAFTVPAHLEQFVAAHPWNEDPTWERGGKAVSSPPQKRSDTVVSPRNGAQPHGDDIRTQHGAAKNAHGAAKNAHGDDTLGGARGIPEESLRNPKAEEGALSRTAVSETLEKEAFKGGKPKTPDPSAARVDTLRRITVAVQKFADKSDHEIAAMVRSATPEDVHSVRTT